MEHRLRERFYNENRMTHIIREFYFINDFVFKADPADLAHSCSEREN